MLFHAKIGTLGKFLYVSHTLFIFIELHVYARDSKWGVPSLNVLAVDWTLNTTKQPTLFILYLKGNHTLFGEKLYFIWKFSSGNSGNCLLGFNLTLTSEVIS